VQYSEAEYAAHRDSNMTVKYFRLEGIFETRTWMTLPSTYSRALAFSITVYLQFKHKFFKFLSEERSDQYIF